MRGLYDAASRTRPVPLSALGRVVHSLQPMADRHPLLAPRLPLEPEGDLRALLLSLRSAAVAPPASNDELLALVEAACKVDSTQGSDLQPAEPPASRASSQTGLLLTRSLALDRRSAASAKRPRYRRPRGRTAKSAAPCKCSWRTSASPAASWQARRP